MTDGSNLLSDNSGVDNTFTQGHRFGVRMEHKFSKNTSILFEPQFNFGNGYYTEQSEYTTGSMAAGATDTTKVNNGKSLNTGNNNNTNNNTNTGNNNNNAGNSTATTSTKFAKDPYSDIPAELKGTTVEYLMNRTITENDKVIYSKYAGTQVEIEKETCIVIKNNDILAVIND